MSTIVLVTVIVIIITSPGIVVVGIALLTVGVVLTGVVILARERLDIIGYRLEMKGTYFSS